MNVLHILASAGGGGSSGGGGGGGIIMLPILAFMIITTWLARRKQVKKAKLAFAAAVASDPAWDDIVKRAKQVFYQFQKDWSNADVAAMQEYLTPTYHEHIRLLMKAMGQLSRQNKMSDVNLESAVIFNVDDKQRNTDDSFDIEFNADASDKLIDTTDGSLIFTNPSSLSEIWHFDRSGKNWLLESIAQLDAEEMIEKGYTSQTVLGKPDSPAVRMVNFANKNNFYYNNDFGWMLMPVRGMLFGASSFGRSDVNYHVIGEYQDVLVQFYQYVPVNKDKRKFSDHFDWFYKPAAVTQPCTIAQATLPKTYSNISIRRRNSFNAFSLTPRGLRTIKLEGVDFNKQFLVYTTEKDAVTSLELLNPSYMEKLLAAPYEINVEVVDNSLYLYSFDQDADYDAMLLLLHEAFEEMKM